MWALARSHLLLRQQMVGTGDFAARGVREVTGSTQGSTSRSGEHQRPGSSRIYVTPGQLRLPPVWPASTARSLGLAGGRLVDPGLLADLSHASDAGDANSTAAREFLVSRLGVAALTPGEAIELVLVLHRQPQEVLLAQHSDSQLLDHAWFVFRQLCALDREEEQLPSKGGGLIEEAGCLGEQQVEEGALAIPAAAGGPPSSSGGRLFRRRRADLHGRQPDLQPRQQGGRGGACVEADPGAAA